MDEGKPYILVEFTARVSVRVYGKSSKPDAIAAAEARVQMLDSVANIGIDIIELESVEW